MYVCMYVCIYIYMYILYLIILAIYIYLISTSLTSQAVPRKGKVCLDGVRFLRTEHTTPVELCKAVQPKERSATGASGASGGPAVSSLLQRVSGGQAKRSAAAVKKYVKHGGKMAETWLKHG